MPIDDENDEDYIKTSYGRLHIRTAECIFLNGGKLTIGAKSRKSRFYWNTFLECSPLEAFRKAKIHCHKALQIGDFVRLRSFKESSELVDGTIIFISSSFTLLKVICKKHSTQRSVAVWLWDESQKLYIRCSYI